MTPPDGLDGAGSSVVTIAASVSSVGGFQVVRADGGAAQVVTARDRPGASAAMSSPSIGLLLPAEIRAPAGSAVCPGVARELFSPASPSKS